MRRKLQVPESMKLVLIISATRMASIIRMKLYVGFRQYYVSIRPRSRGHEGAARDAGRNADAHIGKQENMNGDTKPKERSGKQSCT